MTNKTMLKRQFLSSLKRGTGESYLLVKNNSDVDFSTQIIKGVLNIYAYDGQSENDRAKYLYDIISISKQRKKIRRAILQGLATEKSNTWNLTHLFALTKLFAENNDEEAKQAIYNRFLNHPIEHSDWVGYSEILELDGLNGLFYIAEKFGKQIEQNPENWQDDWIIKSFQDENKNLNVLEELNKQAKKNKFIQIYLDIIKQTKAIQVKNRTKKINYQDIIDEVLNSKPRISFQRKRNLTEKEILQVANRLMNETDKSNIEKLLDIFDFYKFPLDSQQILNLAKQKPSKKNRIADFAIYALKHLESKDIRTFALDKIQNSKNSIDYLEILVSNYNNGDFKLLSEIATKTNNEDKIEQLAGIFTEIFKANKTKECREPMEILYNKMNCAIHRKGIIEILIENNVLSEKIKKELKFDSYLDTRNLVK